MCFVVVGFFLGNIVRNNSNGDLSTITNYRLFTGTGTAKHFERRFMPVYLDNRSMCRLVYCSWTIRCTYLMGLGAYSFSHKCVCVGGGVTYSPVVLKNAHLWCTPCYRDSWVMPCEKFEKKKKKHFLHSKQHTLIRSYQ